MAQPWIKVIPLAELTPAKVYFIALRSFDGNGNPHYQFWSQHLSGKDGWSSKPGIGIRYYGGASLETMILKNKPTDLVCIEVPMDADKRWKARKHLSRH